MLIGCVVVVVVCGVVVGHCVFLVCVVVVVVCVCVVGLWFVVSSSLASPRCLPGPMSLYLYERVTPSVPRNFGPPKADLPPGEPHFRRRASHSRPRAFFTGDVGGAD